jgi:signal peptidase I
VTNRAHAGTAAVRWFRRGVELCLVGVVLVGLGSAVLARVVPATGRTTLIVAGGSMEPAIALGSVAIVEPVDASALHPGDVASMRVPGASAVVTHRIVRIVSRSDGQWIEARGDANASADPVLVPETAIIGRVQIVIPLAGRIMAALARPGGLLVLFGLAGVLLALTWWLESIERGATRRNAIGGRAREAAARSLG